MCHSPLYIVQKLTSAVEHFSPHTVSYLPPTSSSTVYSQHAQAFQRIDAPQTAEDRLLREAAEARIAAALQRSGSYGNLLVPFDLMY